MDTTTSLAASLFYAHQRPAGLHPDEADTEERRRQRLFVNQNEGVQTSWTAVAQAVEEMNSGQADEALMHQFTDAGIPTTVEEDGQTRTIGMLERVRLLIDEQRKQAQILSTLRVLLDRAEIAHDPDNPGIYQRVSDLLSSWKEESEAYDRVEGLLDDAGFCLMRTAQASMPKRLKMAMTELAALRARADHDVSKPSSDGSAMVRILGRLAEGAIQAGGVHVTFGDLATTQIADLQRTVAENDRMTSAAFSNIERTLEAAQACTRTQQERLDEAETGLACGHDCGGYSCPTLRADWKREGFSCPNGGCPSSRSESP